MKTLVLLLFFLYFNIALSNDDKNFNNSYEISLTQGLGKDIFYTGFGFRGKNVGISLYKPWANLNSDKYHWDIGWEKVFDGNQSINGTKYTEPLVLTIFNVYYGTKSYCISPLFGFQFNKIAQVRRSRLEIDYAYNAEFLYGATYTQLLRFGSISLGYMNQGAIISVGFKL